MDHHKTLEEEVLLWALDGDSVNNLIPYVKRELGKGSDEVLNMVKTLAKNHKIKIYLELSARKGSADVDPEDLNEDLLRAELYVTLTKTEETFSRLKEIQ